MATKADLVRRVLKLLGKDAVGQDPSAEDVEAIEGYILGKIDELRKRNIIDVPDVEDIEPAALQWLAMLTAQDASPDFGASMDKTAFDFAEKMLRAIQPMNYVYSPARPDYF